MINLKDENDVQIWCDHQEETKQTNASFFLRLRFSNFRIFEINVDNYKIGGFGWGTGYGWDCGSGYGCGYGYGNGNGKGCGDGYGFSGDGSGNRNGDSYDYDWDNVHD